MVFFCAEGRYRLHAGCCGEPVRPSEEELLGSLPIHSEAKKFYAVKSDTGVQGESFRLLEGFVAGACALAKSGQ